MPVEAIRECFPPLARQHNGQLVAYFDGPGETQVIDVKAMECDFLACSAYKFYGAYTGVLFARAEIMAALDVPKVAPATNEIPEQMETGTQNHEGIVGAGAAVDFLASLATGSTRRERLVNAVSGLQSGKNSHRVTVWLEKLLGTPYRPIIARPSFW